MPYQFKCCCQLLVNHLCHVIPQNVHSTIHAVIEMHSVVCTSALQEKDGLEES